MSSTVDRRWLRGQTRKFVQERPKYELLARTLRLVLEQIRDRHAPLCLVDTRAKTIQSFVEKAIRKHEKYREPWRQLTDLAGGRVVTYTRTETEAICRWLEREEGITIDWRNCLHTQQRLGVGEFGYIASHYIVQLTGPTVMGISIDPGLRGLRCEIQVSTFLQHVWATVGHDRIYKSNLRIPRQIERKSAETAALLEMADAAFDATAASLDRYQLAFEASLPPQKLAQEIERWQAVLAADPHGRSRDELLHRIGRLHLAAARATTAYNIMRPLAESKRADLRRELGRAALLAGKLDEARRHLAAAIALDDKDWLTHKCMGDAHLAGDPAGALAHYVKAHELKPDEPQLLCPLLECDLRVKCDSRVLRLMRGSLQAGIEECQRRIELQVHLPQAYFEHGRLALYLDPARPYDAMAAYARAVATCRHCQELEAELAAVQRIIEALQTGEEYGELEECESLQGFIWVREFMRVALVAKARAIVRDPLAEAALPKRLLAAARRWQDGRLLAGIATPGKPSTFAEPILIVAGGCAPEAQDDIRSCRSLLNRALRGFTGTVIGGGTTAGISGLTARMLGNMPGVTLLGYLPASEHRPPEDRIARAYQIIETRGCGYTPLGPLQTWADLLRAGVAPEDVHVLGVNGGDLAGFEYRLALALGGVVGVVQGSGRAAERMLPDPFWQTAHAFAPLPRDWATIAAFVNLAWANPAPRVARQLARAARGAHERYRRENISKPGKVADNLLPWGKLPPPLKRSNLQQIAYAAVILRRAGFAVVPLKGFAKAPPPPPPAYADRLEQMAEMEHGRYNAERLSSGWRLGDTNDVQRRTNPTLVPWSELPEHIKEYDRLAVRAWPDLLWRARLRIVPAKQ